jgi:adenylylsulfate kinase
MPRDKGWCVWVTGLPGSGKSTIAIELLRILERHNIQAQILSSDELRRVMTPNPTYSLEERNNVYSTLVFIARLLTENGVNTIIDATGNLRRYRENARNQISRFLEAYVKCPLEVCIQRESKRRKTFHAPEKIYEKALKGEAPTVPGIGVPYEAPLHPGIIVNSSTQTPGECAQKIFEKILGKFMRKRF